MGYACCVDNSGNIYISGESNTLLGTGVATPGSHQTTFAGGNKDGFLVKFNSNGIRQWGTYYGGSANEVGNACVTDALGNVYLSGSTMSNNAIATAGSHQATFGGVLDAYLVKFNTNGVRQWGTYYGGGAIDVSDFSCAIDASGNIYLAGETETLAGGGPIIATPGTHQTTYGGLGDGFLVKFNSNGVRQWGTYYGGNSAEYTSGCSTDASGNVYVSGRTYSSNGNSIATPGAFQTAFVGGAYCSYVIKFNANGLREWGTYVGSVNWGTACATVGTGTVYLTGFTGLNTPYEISTPGSFQSTFGGTVDAFLVKLTDCPSTSSSQNVSACDSYTWPVNNMTYTSSGTYVARLTNSTGCDSLVILNLAINNTMSSVSITECDSYTWPVNNTTYTTSGIYTETLTNMLGCDSVITLNLTINNPSDGYLNVLECDSYTWPANNMTYTSSGVYTTILSNTLGCDSIVTLNLTIKHHSNGYQMVSACGAYTWPANNVTYSVSGTYSTILVNSVGCDSIIELHLVMNNSSSVIDVIACNNVSSPSGNYNWTNSGVYMDTIPNAIGCDSIITVNLTVNHSSTSSVSISACDSYTWPVNNMTYSNGGTFSAILTSSLGCDSSITLNLNLVDSPDTSISINGITLISNASGVNYQWIDCNNGNGLILDAVNQSYSPSINGLYAVVIDNGICKDTSACIPINTVGIVENSLTENVKVHPNPTNGLVIIQFDEFQQWIEISLYSVSGQLLSNSSYLNSDNITYDLSSHAIGLYLLKISYGENQQVIYLMKG